MMPGIVAGGAMQRKRSLPELLLQTQIIVPGPSVEQGTIVTASAIAWSAIYKAIMSPPLDEDRLLQSDMKAARNLVESRSLIEAVETAVGKLG